MSGFRPGVKPERMTEHSSDRERPFVRWTLAAVAGLTVGQAWAQDTADPPGANIALGSSYTLDPAPNYQQTRDDDDLTDNDREHMTWFPVCGDSVSVSQNRSDDR